jgi:osmotically inducible protein OsmC
MECLSGGVLDLQLVYPKELGGPGGDATNPEQLFTAGYAACFENALMRVARERETLLSGSSVTAHVGIGREEDGYFRLKVDLKISAPGRERAEIEELARIHTKRSAPISAPRAATSRSTFVLSPRQQISHHNFGSERCSSNVYGDMRPKPSQ